MENLILLSMPLDLYLVAEDHYLNKIVFRSANKYLVMAKVHIKEEVFFMEGVAFHKTQQFD